MTTQEHLQRIKTKCQELLAIAEKRTPGTWWEDHPSVYASCNSFVFTDEQTPKTDANFIASCAGPAEAGWRATIAAIDGWQAILNAKGNHTYMNFANRQLNNILTAWPEELLK